MGPFLSTFGTSGLATSSMPTKLFLHAGALPLTRAATSPHSSFFLTRIVLIRGMAFVYMVAFWIAFQQNKGLIGDTGIAPARAVLDAAQNRGVQNRKRREEWLRLQIQKLMQQLQPTIVRNKSSEKRSRNDSCFNQKDEAFPSSANDDIAATPNNSKMERTVV
ncbi:hypothetical protein IV203_017770 [Nitzschia inconspicua]|uniref:Uncharacterized protein n=1 Tax=Nitzschia inconspicua TaxID=303405 RepID=A0A9K3K7M4_9STRA|nr:hypothetical protein IV203_017770 [Nitzschia inconspicua]